LKFKTPRFKPTRGSAERPCRTAARDATDSFKPTRGSAESDPEREDLNERETLQTHEGFG